MAAFMPPLCPHQMSLLLLHKGIMAAYIDPQGIFKALFVHFSFIMGGEMLILCS